MLPSSFPWPSVSTDLKTACLNFFSHFLAVFSSFHPHLFSSHPQRVPVLKHKSNHIMLLLQKPSLTSVLNHFLTNHTGCCLPSVSFSVLDEKFIHHKMTFKHFKHDGKQKRDCHHCVRCNRFSLGIYMVY